MDPTNEALVDAIAIPGKIQIIRNVRRAMVVYCCTIPNHPAANAMSYHYQVSIQNIISCGMPYERYWPRLEQVLHLGKNNDFLMSELQLAIIRMKK